MRITLSRSCDLKKKFLTFWDGDKYYFFEISSYTYNIRDYSGTLEIQLPV